MQRSLELRMFPYSGGQSTGEIHFQISFEVQQDRDQDDQLRDVDKHLPMLFFFWLRCQ